jgi:POT family proton-dependent oligopeptide transporter
MATTLEAAPRAPTGDLFGQPKGLWVLAGTELWDRISFHGMQAMLVLYMTGDLLVHPERMARIIGFGAYRSAVESMTGPLTDVALATQTFGFYLAFVTGLPLLGGWLGDKIMGRKLAVALGASLMTAGHFLMAFDATFLAALIFLMTGAGMLRGNLSAQIKSLYPGDDPRQTAAFQYYYMAISVGAFIAPIVTGGVAALYGWHVGFGVAGLGMLVGLITYLTGVKHLPESRAGRARPNSRRRTPLTPNQRKRVAGLLLLWPISVLFWIAQSQVWNIYNVWVRDHIDMNLGGFAVPVPWLQSLDGLAPAVGTPLVLWFWAALARRKREPDEFGKMAIGMILFGLAVTLLACSPVTARGPILLPVAFHLVSNLGWIWFAPVTAAVYGTRSPESWRGTLVGIDALSVAAASLISGRMGALYEQISPSMFWLLNACFCFGGAAILMASAPIFRRLIASTNAEDDRAAPPKEALVMDSEALLTS